MAQERPLTACLGSGALMASISISVAMDDPNLLGAVLGDPATWRTWRTALKAAFAVPLDEAELATFQTIAGARNPPRDRVQQLWAIVGRRGGKTRMAALTCCYLATLVDWKSKLSPGEPGYVLCLAPTQRQAQGVLGYCKAMLEASPVLAQQIEGVAAEEARLKGNIVIATHTASYRTVRGRTLLAVVLDESALFRSDESANPDFEILRACVPALLTTKGMVIGISTPYGQRGLLFERHRDHFGKDGDDVLVVQGASTTFNPTLDQGQIDKELAADAEANRAEYLAEFRHRSLGLYRP